MLGLLFLLVATRSRTQVMIINKKAKKLDDDELSKNPGTSTLPIIVFIWANLLRK